MPYYIARTRPGAETECSEQLAFSPYAIEPYFPKLAVISKPKRVRKIRVSLRPAFPGYLFLQGELRPILNQIERVSLCSGLMKVGNVYSTVSDVEIESIRRREAEWQKHPVTKSQAFVIGETIRIHEGAFVGYLGTITDIRKDKAQVNLNTAMRCNFKLDIPYEQLQHVSLAS